VLSGRGLCDELITRPEESYRLWCVVVYDLETSRIGAPYIYDINNLRVKRRLCYCRDQRWSLGITINLPTGNVHHLANNPTDADDINIHWIFFTVDLVHFYVICSLPNRSFHKIGTSEAYVYISRMLAIVLTCRVHLPFPPHFSNPLFPSNPPLPCASSVHPLQSYEPPFFVCFPEFEIFNGDLLR